LLELAQILLAEAASLGELFPGQPRRLAELCRIASDKLARDPR
jgi:hypothetical protein